MAVTLSFTLVESKDCKNATFNETTGIYSVSNLTGWGTPNELTSDAIVATVQFTSPSGIVYTSIDMISAGSFPRTSGIAVSIPSTTVDSTLTDFDDGFWIVTYSVTTGTTTYTTTNTIFFSCKIEKEVCKLVSALDLCDCTCDPDKVNRALQAKAYLYAINCAIEYDQLDKAKSIFATLRRLLDCSIC